MSRAAPKILRQSGNWRSSLRARPGVGPAKTKELAELGMWGHAGEAMGGEDGGESDEGVVAEVKQEANEDSAGAGTGECEDDAYGDQQGDEAPGPAELCPWRTPNNDPVSTIAMRVPVWTAWSGWEPKYLAMREKLDAKSG